MTGTSALIESRSPARTRFLWLDLTRKCQLACTPCYNDSGPDGTHGTMTRQDWIAVLDQAARYGIEQVQFIGGEVTLHPDAADLVAYALTLGLRAEVYTNLVHVTDTWWKLLCRDGVCAATSYYSDDATQHNTITGRTSHQRTRANIEKAVRLGVDLRVSIIVGSETQRAEQARGELEGLGVSRIGVDHVRPFGRAANGRDPDPAGLCGRCGTGKAAIDPDGRVSPCVFATWMNVGNVHEQALADILAGGAMTTANQTIRDASAPDDEDCEPDQWCTPGGPGSGCKPRA